MAHQGVLDHIQQCVDLKVPDRMPVFALSEEFDVRMAGMTYEEYCQDADKIFACQQLVVDKFGYDWCWLQIDDCLEFEVLGVGCKGEGNILRATCDYLPASSETVKGLRMPDFSRDGRLPAFLRAIGKCKSHYQDTVCVAGRTAGPFSSVGLLYGIPETMMLLLENQDLLRETLEFFTEMQIQFGLAQIKAGADAIWFGDCIAASNFISPAQFSEFAFPYAKRVVDAYRKAGAWTFYHPSEARASHLQLMADLGVSALSVSDEADIGEAKTIVQGKTCLMGNLSPVNVLQNGTPSLVRSEAERILKTAAPGGGFLFDSGEMIPRDTPEENMRAMVETLDRFNAGSL